MSVGSPSAAVPQPTALNVTSRKSASPAGTLSGAMKADATPTSEPVVLAAAIALGLAPLNTVAAAYGAPRTTAWTWSSAGSKVMVTPAPLVGTDALWTTRAVNVPPWGTVPTAGSIRRLLPVAAAGAAMLSPTARTAALSARGAAVRQTRFRRWSAATLRLGLAVTVRSLDR